MFNEMSFFNGAPETVADQLTHLDKWGASSTQFEQQSSDVARLLLELSVKQ